MRTIIPTLAIITSIFAAPAAAYDSDEAWNLLGEARAFENADFTWAKELPADLQNQPTIRVDGYIVPVQAQAFFTTFLMVQDAQNCPFCGSGGGYGPVLEVILKRPIDEIPEFSSLSVSGTIVPYEDPYSAQVLRMVDATVVSDIVPPTPDLIAQSEGLLPPKREESGLKRLFNSVKSGLSGVSE